MTAEPALLGKRLYNDLLLDDLIFEEQSISVPSATPICKPRPSMVTIESRAVQSPMHLKNPRRTFFAGSQLFESAQSCARSDIAQNGDALSCEFTTFVG